MASDFRKFAGYTVDELKEWWPDFGDDERFACISFRPDEIKTVYIPKSRRFQKYIAVEYWDGQIFLCDRYNIEEVRLSDLYTKFSEPFYDFRKGIHNI